MFKKERKEIFSFLKEVGVKVYLTEHTGLLKLLINPKIQIYYETVNNLYLEKLPNGTNEKYNEIHKMMQRSVLRHFQKFVWSANLYYNTRYGLSYYIKIIRNNIDLIEIKEFKKVKDEFGNFHYIEINDERKHILTKEDLIENWRFINAFLLSCYKEPEKYMNNNFNEYELDLF